jgi:hypothetical protein
MRRSLLAVTFGIVVFFLARPTEAVDCVSAPLPSTPVAPVFSMNVQHFSDHFRIDLWRHPCNPASGVSFIVLIRVTPTTTAPFVCASDFFYSQNALQWDVSLRQSLSGGSSSFCGDLFAPTTFIPIASGQSSQPDLSKAFSLIYTGEDEHFNDLIFTLNVAAAPGSSSLCIPNATTLCIDDQPGDGRFQIHVAFATNQGGGSSGDGRAIFLSSVGVSQGGLMWFFEASNPELLIKILRRQRPFLGFRERGNQRWRDDHHHGPEDGRAEDLHEPGSSCHDSGSGHGGIFLPLSYEALPEKLVPGDCFRPVVPPAR